MSNVFYYDTKIGKLAIAEHEGRIAAITCGRIDCREEETPLIKTAYKQLKQYFNGRRKSFDFPINPKGTDFQKKVWAELRKIPYGKTATYKEIAQRIGNPKAYRAVGTANNKNPLLIVTPCHRVIGSNGSLTGFAAGLKIKESLLKLENKER